MKKILTFIISVSVLCSCNFLKEEPTTRLLGGSAFDTEEALEAQVFGVYGTLSNTYTSTNWFYYFNCSSLLVHWKSTRSGLNFEQALRGTLYADPSTGRGILTSLFASIYKANAVLAGLDSSPVDESYKKEIEGEVRFLRAYLYFTAVRMFGDVPLFLKPVTSDTDAYVKRTSYLDVYAQIIDDLKFAFENMRSEARQKQATGNAGRPYKYAAKACLAQVYLQIASMLQSPDDQAFGTLESGEVKPDFTALGINNAETAWRLTLETADDVIANSGYALEYDYRTLFNWDPESSTNGFFSKERVFVLQNTPNGGTGSICSIYSLPGYMLGTVNAITLSHASTPGMVRPSRIVFQEWAKRYGGDLNSSGNMYVNCKDPRLDASYIYGSYMATADDSGNLYPSPQKKVVYPQTNGNDQAYFKKYFFPQFDQDAGYADYYLLRFAELYFIAAEAIAELGENGMLGDSYDYIECVHERARRSTDNVTGQPQWTRGQFATKEELINAIFWERVFEMGGEGHEWFDSHRRGARWLLDNVFEPMHKFLLEPAQSSYKSIYWYNIGYEVPRTLENARCCLLCEYPQYEIMYNQALTSNDQNFFNQKKTTFQTGGKESENNEAYDDEEDIINW